MLTRDRFRTLLGFTPRSIELLEREVQAREGYVLETLRFNSGTIEDMAATSPSSVATWLAP